MLKVIRISLGLALLSLTGFPYETRRPHSLMQSEIKPKAMVTRVDTFFLALYQ